VARAGNQQARRKLVVLAHHDAPHSGFVFHPKPQHWIWEHHPELIENANRSIPFWAPVALGPVACTAGAVTGRRWLLKLGTALSAGTVAAMIDIARSPVVPGANDNASGSVGLVMAARALAAEQPEDLDVWLVSCGSEEQMQPGIRAFLERHAGDLPPDSTWFVNLETIGSPELALLEGEGTIWMRDYDPAWTDSVDQAAAGAGITVRRGLRAGASTDSVAVHRKGYRVATLTSITQWKSLSHYHWPSDIPENLDWSTISEAVGVVLAVVGRLRRG
jgi:Zn-dependent M28 family amino/carboxypeptidase